MIRTLGIGLIVVVAMMIYVYIAIVMFNYLIGFYDRKAKIRFGKERDLVIIASVLLAEVWPITIAIIIALAIIALGRHAANHEPRPGGED